MKRIGKVAAAASLLIFAAPAFTQTSSTQAATTATKVWDQADHFKRRCDQIRNAIAAQPPGSTNTLVLLGDSITEGIKIHDLAGMVIINEGVSGDRVENGETKTGVRNRLDLVAQAKPACVCVMIGINDFWGAQKDVATVEMEYRSMAPELRAAVPNARIVIESILPAGEAHKDLQPKVDELNRKLPSIAADTKAEFLLLDPVMKSANGLLRPEFTTDGIHLTPAGYTAWMKRLEQHLASLQQ